MAWQVYVFPHAISTHAEEPEVLEEVEKAERSMLHKTIYGLTTAFMIAVLTWIILHYI
jgi:hypothetical protein